MIYKFEPYLKSVIWGGDKIQKFKGIPQEQACIGESWELSGVADHQSIVSEGADKGLTLADLLQRDGEKLVGRHVIERYGQTFPLLVKIIDAKRDLSVQVHPNDALAMQRHHSLGKSEMWYVFQTEPGAKIYAGFTRDMTPQEYAQMVEEKRIMEVVKEHEARPGDVFFLPAGRIHAIGAGVVLAEIQETSDVTYRVYDYDRKDADGNTRQLHTQEALEALDYKAYPEYRTLYHQDAPLSMLVEDEHFVVRRLKIDGEHALDMPADSFMIVMCLDGYCSLSGMTLKAGETVLVSADHPGLELGGQATLLLANC